MKVLITGKGSSGSWQIRGAQLGAAIGATVAPVASHRLIEEHDIVVLVKRAPPSLIEILRACGKPVVWDAVDFWKQPDRNPLTQEEACDLLRERIEAIAPRAIVFPTHAMMADARFEGPRLVLPHHARPGQRLHQVGERVRLVGYEGRVDYLAEWRPAIEDACAKRGWAFVLNPVNLGDLDIGIAARGGPWTGYMPRAWKSNVKLANFQAVGLPCALDIEESYRETSSGGVAWLRSPDDVDAAFERLADPQERRLAHAGLLADAGPVSLEAVAARMRWFLGEIL